ncbi:hypothetical protein SAMN04489867_2306 [Pedococcus dokdonensis]|uniref:Uncharacterized protein n=1 Tax=Pedococcus dokdonensis TaxID=443156 RepID=A0A1H0SEF0_9MICO|nr:hypothetical protein [Pedococcus dokdonensis]SDP39556.1 hypothetical protein SAMN04489867_2306 [Pedococcus dokdonensis]
MNSKRVSIAVAVTAIGLAVAPGVAFAADGQVPCGTAAVPAVYSTVVVPGTPAVTHEESEWSLVSQVVEKKWHRWVVDTPAQPEVMGTIHHDAVYETVVVTPAKAAYDEPVLVSDAYDEPVTVPAHDAQEVDVPEHQVQEVDVPEHQVQEVDVPEHQVQEVDVPEHQVQEVDVPEHQVQELVTAAYDDPPVMTSPAVYVIEYKFISKNGAVRWESDPNWNANGNSSSGGWVGTGETRQGALISPAVYAPAVHHDAVYKTVTVPATYKTVTVPATYKTVTVPATYKWVTVPATYKWVTVPATYKTVHYDAVTTIVHHDAVWDTIHHDAVPEVTKQELVTEAYDEDVVVTPATPEVGHWDEAWGVDSPGDDWSDTGETRTVDGDTQLVWAAESPGQYWTATGQTRTVEDTPAVPDSTTQVLVTEAIPAGPACPTPGEPTTGNGEEVVPEPADPASAVPGAAGLGKPAAAANPTTELAFTGSDPRLALLGLGFVLTGLGVSAGYRKVARQR